ncbi:class I SAM-dependent methyltransferase [Fibrobacterota bacterium]
MKNQSTHNQKGEIVFRKKLLEQQIGEKRHFQDEFAGNEVEHILRQRMEETRRQMGELMEKGVGCSPYIEIGAERCQRSLVMENDMQTHGAAVDISYDMLNSCGHYGDVFNKKKFPERICCDANNLPFLSNSIPFAFCYETLHHFPDPAPVIGEIHRVLAGGGYFFLSEEPFKQMLHLNLYRGAKIYSEQSLRRTGLRKVLDRFFCEHVCNEVEHGIIENHDIPLGAWKDALRPFGRKDITLSSSGMIRSKLVYPKNIFMYALNYLLGGSLSGLCKKQGGAVPGGKSIKDSYICPSCHKQKHEERLRDEGDAFTCPACRSKYPLYNGILFLFDHDKFRELYPEIVEAR